MKAKEVSYRRVFALGNFETETYSVTVELEDRDESVQLAIEAARKHVEMAHAKVLEEREYVPQKVEKDTRILITNDNLHTILKGIDSGKIDADYIDNAFRVEDSQIITLITKALISYNNNNLKTKTK